jgi:hypothetical protein
MYSNGYLPPQSLFKLRPWREFYGTEYYGAIHVAAEYCGLRSPPNLLPGTWQHGIMPPWWQVQPEIMVFDAPRSQPCFVARQDEVEYLAKAGYEQVRAIGLPIIYTKPSGLLRTKGSLLVMPTHSMPRDKKAPSFDKYIRQICSIRQKFERVVACVSSPCIEKGLLAPQFQAEGIEVVDGAGVTDANALRRMRALFESFEFITTDNFGSHVFYALYFGAKVSIWGEPTPMYRENVLQDSPWAAYPDAVDRLLSPETERKAEMYLAPLRIEPWIGVQNVDSGKWMLGHENKLSSAEMRACFGWTSLNVTIDSIGQSVRRSPLWRVGAAMKRRLSAVGKRAAP